MAMMVSWPAIAAAFIVAASLSSPAAMRASAAAAARGGGGNNPPAGFAKVDLTGGDVQVQRPYDVPESRRFRYRDGVWTFWVYDSDKPFNTATHTNPRTEVRLRVINTSLQNSILLHILSINFL